MRNPTRTAALLVAATLSISCTTDPPTAPDGTASSGATLVTSMAGQSHAFPDLIPLPDGWQPEGIVAGYGTSFYAGSLAGAGIYRGDFLTGEGDVLDESAGGIVVGLAFDKRSGYVFAAGERQGDARVYDGTTGALLATFPLAVPGASFINDVVVTRDAAYFTNSFAAELYRVPLGPQGGLPDADAVETMSLGGDWVQVGPFNANGIDATPNGKTLIVVHSGLGNLYTVDPKTAEATQIDLGGDGMVASGDGFIAFAVSHAGQPKEVTS